IPHPPQYPSSLAHAIQTEKPDHVLNNRATSGPSTGAMKGVTFGTTTGREARDEYLLHFFADVDKAVNTVLKGRSEPLIAAGVEHEIALYRGVNTYPHLL